MEPHSYYLHSKQEVRYSKKESACLLCVLFLRSDTFVYILLAAHSVNQQAHLRL